MFFRVMFSAELFYSTTLCVPLGPEYPTSAGYWWKNPVKTTSIRHTFPHAISGTNHSATAGPIVDRHMMMADTSYSYFVIDGQAADNIASLHRFHLKAVNDSSLKNPNR